MTIESVTRCPELHGAGVKPAPPTAVHTCTTDRLVECFCCTRHAQSCTARKATERVDAKTAKRIAGKCAACGSDTLQRVRCGLCPWWESACGGECNRKAIAEHQRKGHLEPEEVPTK